MGAVVIGDGASRPEQVDSRMEVQDEAEGALQFLWRDEERVYYRGRRPDEDGKLRSVLFAAPIGRPSAAVLDRLANEYNLKEELDATWALRPLGFLRGDGRTMLAFEDVEGFEPLDPLLAGPMEIAPFLRLAIGAAVAVRKLHERNIIHKDLKPANILVNQTTGEARLTGFGVASRLRRERQSPDADTIAGTLAYMAPEQTGRINRPVDFRSDLYALGVTLYRMLVGALPFAASEPLDLVHCHIARHPAAPIERRPATPPIISAVVMKLLAKSADERYQTAAGLEADLRRAYAEWRSCGKIDAFPLGERDVPNQLLKPERLYGREREFATLRAAYDRVAATGEPELVLIAGQAGVGKSALVDQLRCSLTPNNGLFASGKFDQYKRDIPYSSLAQALAELIRPLLGKSEAELAPTRAALGAALGPNGALMTALVPDLEPLIGPQPPAPELPPRDAQRRLHALFHRLLGVFARPGRPLALFLDDLQWVDEATLDLLEDLLARPDLRHLLLIGAYRYDEIAPAYRLRQLRTTHQSGGREIILRPHGLKDVSRLVSDALHGQKALPLARLVHEKTGGNPFFVIQFLNALAEEGLLAFAPNAARWTWDIERIQAKGYTDNLVEFLVGKLRRLPAATQTALKQLSCLGLEAPISTLAFFRRGGEEDAHTALRPAVRAGVLLQESDGYRFLHDRVREAAYTLIPEDERARAHLAIGRGLLARVSPQALEEDVFEIVGQLNRGAALIRSGKERARLAELNLTAGRRAKFAAAYGSALTYLAAGAAILPADSWRRRHDLAFALALHRAECEFLTGALAEADARLAELADRAASPPELASVARLRVDLFMTLGRSDRAIAIGLECLGRFGIAWSARPTRADVEEEYARLWRRLGERPIETLVDLPRMSDARACAMTDVLTALVTPALYTDENLRALVIGRMGNLSLEHGISDASCYAYTAVGNVLGLYFGNYEAAFRFGQLGLDLAEKPGMERLRARVYLAFGNLAKASPRHVRTGQMLARHAFEIAQQTGDLTYAAISCNNLVTRLLASAVLLADVQREAEAGLEFARRARFGLVADLLAAQLRFIRTTRDLTPIFGRFDDDAFDEQQFERGLDSAPTRGIEAWMYWIRKLQARVLADDPAGALAAAEKAESLLWMSPAIFERADYHFYAALALAAHCATLSASETARYGEALGRHRRQLEAWAEHAPESFADRAALLGAEIARIEGRELEAERLYEQAIRSARQAGFVHHEAIAYERASSFHQARGFDEIATLYLANARRCYSRWGADGKARRLDGSIPQASEEDKASPGPTSTIGAAVQHLDLATVIKVSQALSGEIVVEKLIDALMRMAIAQGGAQRALLVLCQGDAQRIAAEAAVAGDSVAVRLSDDALAETSLPRTVLQYALRTRHSLVVGDAASLQPFAADPYVLRHNVRSVLCLPLINQSKLVGALYLENNLASHIFGPRRTAVLELLASQAATALENTRLYHDLVEREAKIKRLVDANIIGIFTWRIPREGEGEDDGEEVFIEVNDAFLRMLGYDRADFVTGFLRRSELTPSVWRERDKETIAELRRSGVAQPFEKEYYAKDGRRVPVLMGLASFDDTRTSGVAFVVDLTERKRTENALLRSEARLAEAQRVAHVGWWERDFVADKVSLSEEARRIFGVTAPDSPRWSDSWRRLIHPDDRDRLSASLEAALRGAARYDLEYRVVRPDGETRTVHSQADVTWDEAGRPLRQFGVMQDVTELRQAEAELRASEARFRTFVDHATDAFFLLDDQSKVIDANRQACEGLGYSREELIGKRRSEFDIGVDEISVADLKKRLATGQSVVFETRHRRKDGSSFPVEIRVGRFEQGGDRFLCLARDITERKEAEESIRRSEAYLMEAQRLSHTGTSVFNAQGAIYESEEMRRIFGLDTTRGVSDEETVLQRVHPEDRERVRQALRRALTEKGEYTVNFRVVRPDGTTEHVESTGHPFFSADGDLAEYVVTHVVVTERVRSQEQSERLRQLEADLAHMNRLSVMGELTATLAHEILHPVATARNNARAAIRFLEKNPPDLREVKEALNCIVSDADRAKDIVARVREHTKKTPPQTTKVEINEAIAEIGVMVRSAAEKNGVSMRTEFADGPVTVEGDRVQLQQVMLNLILNAVEAMSEVEVGARELSIRTERASGGDILVAVRDSGPGLDPAQMERAFNPFYTTKSSGLGLGLSICRSIIDAHGGRLWVEANVPRGAVFQFTLPSVRAAS